MPTWLAVLPFLLGVDGLPFADQSLVERVTCRTMINGTCLDGTAVGGTGGRGGDARVNIYVVPQGGGGGAGGAASQGPGTSNAPTTSSPRLTYWEHNNSLLYLEATGASRRFYYERPRPGMMNAGATSGTLLFEGERQRDTYSGTAYVFAGSCGKFSYSVTGRVVDEKKIVMSGSAPKVDRNTCNVVGSKDDTLVFDLRTSR